MKKNAPASYKKNDLYIDDVSLREIAKKYGTPVYCYSATRIEENFLAYRDAFKKIMRKDDFTICYATKANGNISILRLLQKLGAGADIVSGGELTRALTAGIPARKIVYSGEGKTIPELEQALRAGIRQINVESEQEMHLISKVAKRLKKTVHIAFRINPDVDAKTHKKITTGKKENKFGVDLADAPRLYAKAKKLPNIKATSVAVHIGSQLMSIAPYARAYTRVAALIKTLRRQGHTITTVDIGGGIGVRYKNETPPDLYLYALMVRDIILPLNVHVILEPGRSIVADAGLLLSSVLQVKKGHGKNFMILDAAMNDLMRPAMYDAYHEILPCKKNTRKKSLHDVVGPVCETGDTFLTNELLPHMTEGEYVALMTAGAYGSSMSSNYNTRPLLAEVLVRGKTHKVIRRKQSISDILKHEIT